MIDNFSKIILGFKAACRVDGGVCASLVEVVSKYQNSFSNSPIEEIYNIIKYQFINILYIYNI
ncbi:hypothetical protein C4Q31_15715 [Leptospira borgpetersenii serovar Ceylonica]|nr:hypothetical protein C4Q31_15715 [Leptospira borgpetersenii serovar Ceylonica]